MQNFLNKKIKHSDFLTNFIYLNYIEYPTTHDID